MNRSEFENLRELPGKKIVSDIKFIEQKDSSPNLTFENIKIYNSLDLDIVLNGTFKPEIPSFTLNFVIRGIGPICRLDVNGTVHKDVGRTHKHDLMKESDPRNNLPHAISRPELSQKSVKEIWSILCRQAHIIHEGNFYFPDEEEEA